MASIRKRLLFNLTLLFLVSWVAVIIATYVEAHHEIEELFDAQLSQAAGVIEGLMREQIGDMEHADPRLGKDIYGHKYEHHVSFQLWRGGRLLLRSQSAPTTRLSSGLGFSDEMVGDTVWRVFAVESGENYTIYTAEDYKARTELISHITRDSIFPLIWALPLAAVLIWVGIGQGLTPLKRVADEVAQRSPRQLDPLSSRRIPEEILPLTTSLNDLLQRLRAAFEKERSFTSDAAHELRTPLASIKTQAQVALRAKNAGERNQALENIIRGVDRNSHLVEQMLTLARLEPDLYDRRFEDVDLVREAAEVVADLAPVAIENGIDLEFHDETPDKNKCVVQGSASGLMILIRNLVDNAIRYTPRGGTIAVLVSKHDDQCMLSVTDTGPGIAAQDRQRVFDRFYRRAGNDSYGCGLGLSIVQRIAQLHQAEVSLTDNPDGRGLRVEVRFMA
jgi:signal transduction histidine kinase